MANVKMSFIGLLDMLRFKNMKVQRDRIIGPCRKLRFESERSSPPSSQPVLHD